MKNMSLATLSVRQLQRAVEIKQRIEALEQELGQILGAAPAAPIAVQAAKKRTMSAAARAKIAAAQKAKWAERKKAAAPVKPAPKKKRKVSPEGRARIAAASKARWARFRAEKKGTQTA
jgi:hypothetical protein